MTVHRYLRTVTGNEEGGTMKYEIVIDRLFFVNLLLNYILLNSAINLLHIRVRRIRLILGAAMGSAGLCISFLLPFGRGYGRILFLCAGVLPLTIFIMLKSQKLVYKVLTLCLYMAGIVIVGKLTEIIKMAWKGDSENICFILVTSSVLVWLLMKLIRILKTNCCSENTFCKVEFKIEGTNIVLNGLVDTGNLLMDPIFHKPVHILEESVISDREEIKDIPLENLTGFHMIPYHTIGNHGVLSVVEVEEFVIFIGERQIQLGRQLCGVTPRNLSGNHKYQLIVNKRAW